jgi:hypothetical protein
VGPSTMGDEGGDKVQGVNDKVCWPAPISNSTA